MLKGDPERVSPVILAKQKLKFHNLVPFSLIKPVATTQLTRKEFDTKL